MASPAGKPGGYGAAFVPNMAVKLICRNCKNPEPNIVEEFGKGDLVCGDCGLILGDRVVDTRSEWRTFAGDDGDDPSRVGAASNGLLGNADLATTISFRDGNSGMSKTLQKAQNHANSMANMSGRSNTSHILSAWARITEMCDVIQLPRAIAEIAKHVYKFADDKRIVKGKAADVINAACIMIACRQGKAARSFQEICELTNVPKKDLGTVFKSILKAMHDDETMSSYATAGPSSDEQPAEALVPRFCGNVGFTVQETNAAKYVVAETTKVGQVDGRAPTSIAAGAIYLIVVLFSKATRPSDIAKVSGVSDTTLKLICRMISTRIDEVIKPEWATTYKAGYDELVKMGKAYRQDREGVKPELYRSGTNTPKPEPKLEKLEPKAEA